MIYRSLGQLIREEREEIGLRLEDVQQMTGLSLSRLSRIESNGVSAEQASMILSKISPSVRLSVRKRDKDAYVKLNIVLDSILSLHYLTGLAAMAVYRYLEAFSAVEYIVASEERLRLLSPLELCDDILSFCRKNGGKADISSWSVEDRDLEHERQRVLLKKMGYSAIRQLSLSYSQCVLMILTSELAQKAMDDDSLLSTPPSMILYEFIEEIKSLA